MKKLFSIISSLLTKPFQGNTTEIWRTQSVGLIGFICQDLIIISLDNCMAWSITLKCLILKPYHWQSGFPSIIEICHQIIKHHSIMAFNDPTRSIRLLIRYSNLTKLQLLSQEFRERNNVDHMIYMIPQWYRHSIWKLVLCDIRFVAAAEMPVKSV